MSDLNQKITVILGDEKNHFQTRETLGIDRDNLDEEMANQAVTYSWFVVTRARARAMISDVEAEIRDYDAELDPRIRAKAKEAEQKITEAGVTMAIRRDEHRASLKVKLRELQATEGLLDAFADALKQRKDMLVSLGFARRNELGTPTVAEMDRIKQNLGKGN